MKILRKAKGNPFLVFVVLCYLLLFVVRPQTGVAAVKNSAYYVREMLLVMPVIFILTALLDLWVPKEKIMRYLGREAGLKGVAFSLILGSVSAGPIYAAFPLCQMLHKKGASVRNLVIILSAWAVIKVPMLLNEMKFLGVRFMAVRWVLTVLAIVAFSWITAKLVRDDELPAPEEEKKGYSINEMACIGCSLCARGCPEAFEMRGGKAALRECADPECVAKAAEACPVGAIALAEEADGLDAAPKEVL